MDNIHSTPTSPTNDTTQTLSPALPERQRSAFERRRLLPMGILLTLLLCVTTLLIRQFTFVVHVKVDGEVVGAVSDSQVFEELVGSTSEVALNILGSPAVVEESVSYTYRLASITVLDTLDMLDTQPLEREIFDRLDGISVYYAVTVDGEQIGYVSDPATLQTAKEERLDSILEDGALSAAFLSEVSYEPEVTEEGEALSLAELLELVDSLPVQTVRQVTYVETVPFEVTIVEDFTLFNDVIEVLQEGADGEIEIFAELVHIDDREVEHTILDTKVLSDAVPEIILEGALERPLTASFGEYIWPTTGNVSSPFGPRRVSVGSSNHQGIDITAPHGTPVLAADGGEVFFTGWFGGFGNLIKILHDNGHVTYYAHLSSMNVSVGDRVYRGQHIGGVGSTGVSSGNHLHFEIRINGVPVDPMPWLP